METDWQVCSTDQIIRLSQYWKWTFFTGLIYLLLGISAFSLPLASTLGLTIAIAMLLIFGGGILLLQAFKLRRFHGTAVRFSQSILSILAGILMLRYPGGGALGIALVLSFYFLIRGLIHWTFAMSLRPHKGWGWEMFISISALLLGTYIFATFPFSALWVPGVLLGVDLVVGGSGMIGLSLVARKCLKDSNLLHPTSQSA